LSRCYLKIKIIKPIQFLILFVLLFLSCKYDKKYTYAIKDFRQSIQPCLTEIVSKGIVGHDTSVRFLEANATDGELKQLIGSEHPILRAVAFRTMLDRPSFNHFDLLMSHLDDTATVAMDAGEFGIWYRLISDDIIEHSVWKNITEKNKTIEEVISKHNYLRSAYTILTEIEPQDKYYNDIKKMALQDRRFDEIEDALYALAKFKKSEDIDAIKNILLSHSWEMESLSFRILKEFPNEVYLEVFEKYYKGNLYRSICNPQDNYGGIQNAIDFFNSIASYKNSTTAEILDTILNRKPFMRCTSDSNYLKHELILAIWNNQCEPYSKMRKQIEAYVLDYNKNNIGIPIDQVEMPAKIRWLSH
jgi:hypothetical protein